MIKFLQKLTGKPLVVRMITLGDQVMFAAGNFMLTILLARYYSEKELAAYGMALSVALILQGVQRNTYVVQNSLLDFKIIKSRGRKILAEQLIALVPILVVLMIAAFIAASVNSDSLISLTFAACVACYAIYTQLEFERIILMKYKKFLIPGLTAFAYFLLTGALLFFNAGLTFYQLTAVLTVFAVLKALVLFHVVGMPDLKGGWKLLRSDARRNFGPAFFGVMGHSGFTHAPVLLLGFLSTPMQAAGFVAMRGLMQILQILIRSMDIFDKNFFRNRVSNSNEGIRKVMNSQMLIYGVVSMAFCGMVCVFSQEIIHVFYAGKYQEFTTTLYAWAGIVVFFSILQPLESVMIVKKIFNRYNMIRLWIGLLACLVLALTVKPFGALGAAIICLAAGVGAFTVGYILAIRKLRAA